MRKREGRLLQLRFWYDHQLSVLFQARNSLPNLRCNALLPICAMIGMNKKDGQRPIQWDSVERSLRCINLGSARVGQLYDLFKEFRQIVHLNVVAIKSIIWR